VIASQSSCHNYNILTPAGGTADLLDLPARGIYGNSHMLMMDRNSDEVAGLVQTWMAAKGLMK
jgi:hypothetical protein